MNAYLPLLLQAREVEALARLPVAGLTAGKTHSAAVLAGGEALTWGDGRDGKLGHGTTGGCCHPLCSCVQHTAKLMGFLLPAAAALTAVCSLCHGTTLNLIKCAAPF